MAKNWTGVTGSTEHRTVGPHRAWCYQDGEWCYPPSGEWGVDDEGCDCCMETAGYVKTWVKRPPEEPATPR
jgi:hypothetical protein